LQNRKFVEQEIGLGIFKITFK